MNRNLLPALPVLALLLSGAACQTPLTPLAADAGLKLRVDARLKTPCAGVVKIPDKALSEAETARLWGQDRGNLGACRKRHAALVKSVEVLER